MYVHGVLAAWISPSAINFRRKTAVTDLASFTGTGDLPGAFAELGQTEPRAGGRCPVAPGLRAVQQGSRKDQITADRVGHNFYMLLLRNNINIGNAFFNL